MYNSRQASLSSQVIAEQVFIRGNVDKLDYIFSMESESEDTEFEIESDSTESSDTDVA